MPEQTSFEGMLEDGFCHKTVRSSGFSLFLADQTRKVHFIRHAEGYYNVATAESGVVLCSHGTKDWRDVAPMLLRRPVAPSTIRVPSSSTLSSMAEEE